jgi:hypothetical protein
VRQRTLGILGGALLVVGAALAAVSGIVAQSTANLNSPLPANSSIGNQRSEPGGLPIQGGQRPGPFFGGPGGRGPNGPNHEGQPAN